MEIDDPTFKKVETSGVRSPLLGKWFDICTALKRAPTATLEAFCLAEDDPRLLQGKIDRAKQDFKSSKKRSTSQYCSLLFHPASIVRTRF